MMKLHEAIQFASRMHKGKFVHAVEVMQILASMNAGEELQIAGLLHNATERKSIYLDQDPRISEADIRENFGERVAELACCRGTVEELEEADRETQLLIMADSVAHLRKLTYDSRWRGESIWNSCEATKELQSWYYSQVQDVLCDMQDDEETRSVYWELVNLYKDLFVSYHLDDDRSLIYQTAEGLGGYVLSRDEPEWYPMEGELPEGLEKIGREEAEAMEELWSLQAQEDCHDEMLEGNERIEEAILNFREHEDKESLEHLASVLVRRMEEFGHVLLPIEDGIEEGSLMPRTVTADDGEVVIAAFTNRREMRKGPDSDVLSIRIQHLFALVMELEEVGGIVLNPWGDFMYIGKDLIAIIQEEAELPETDVSELGDLMEDDGETKLLN